MNHPGHSLPTEAFFTSIFRVKDMSIEMMDMIGASTRRMHYDKVKREFTDEEMEIEMMRRGYTVERVKE